MASLLHRLFRSDSRRGDAKE